MSEIIRIMIVDDHCMVREGLKKLLELRDREDRNSIRVVGEAGDGEECLEHIDELNPDVLLLDISMPKMNGLRVLEELHRRKGKPKVLVLTIYNEAEYLSRAMEIGAQGYVLKDSESVILKRAIFTVYRGENYIDKTMLPVWNDTVKNVKSVPEEKLTRRELEVLKLLSEGLYNKEIAYKLSISEKTVKNHVSNIFRKIGVFDRTQAAVYAIRNNILEF